MKIGIFGSPTDAQCQAVAALLQQRGAPVLLVDSMGLSRGDEGSYLDDHLYYGGQCLDDVGAWYVRYVTSPLPPAFAADETYYLFADWFKEYMHRREQFGFQLSTLLILAARGVPLVNPPENGSVVQLKTYQLAMASSCGLTIPRTLVTNQASRVRMFATQVPEVVYKPCLGGAICRPLDDGALELLEHLPASPVIFQERVRGMAVRVTIVGDKVVSSVKLPSLSLDYRDDPTYIAGNQIYVPAELPSVVADGCLRVMKACGLLFSGIDLILKDDGTYVFLEANSSPAYLDIEQKTKTPITGALVNYLLKLANLPNDERDMLQQARTARSFVAYAHPFTPTKSIDP